MSVLSKALQAANRVARTTQKMTATKAMKAALPLPQMPDVAALVRDALAPLTKPQSGPASCMGKPMAFDNFVGVMAAFRGFGLPASAPAADHAAPPAPGSTVARSFTGPAGSRAYKLFRPAIEGPPRGLIVMLHGCTQNPDDFAAGTRMNAAAQVAGFLVAYPAQSRSANSSGCWNWFETKDQARGKGEPGIIAGIARSLAEEFDIPPGRIFVAGLSAGGAMAAILAETDPDLFGAVGIHSGLAFGAASDMSSAFAAMKGTGGMGRAEAGVLGRGVPLIVFQGDADHTVHPSNADAIVARFRAREADLLPETIKGTAGGKAFARTTGRTADGAPRFEHWTLAGTGHAWSGGSNAGSYTDTAGPDASAEMVRFFETVAGLAGR